MTCCLGDTRADIGDIWPCSALLYPELKYWGGWVAPEPCEMETILYSELYLRVRSRELPCLFLMLLEIGRGS